MGTFVGSISKRSGPRALYPLGCVTLSRFGKTLVPLGLSPAGSSFRSSARAVCRGSGARHYESARFVRTTPDKRVGQVVETPRFLDRSPCHSNRAVVALAMHSTISAWPVCLSFGKPDVASACRKTSTPVRIPPSSRTESHRSRTCCHIGWRARSPDTHRSIQCRPLCPA